MVMGLDQTQDLYSWAANPCTARERESEEFRRQAEADTRHLDLLEKENSEMASRMESLESQLASQQTQV